jgi:hypothetical protein
LLLLPVALACGRPAEPELVRSPAAPAAQPAIGPAVCAPARDVQPLAVAEFGTAPAENLRIWVETLADPALGGRESGTRGSLVAARTIAERFAERGAQPPGAGGYCIEFAGEGFRDQNVVAHFPVADPVCPWVLIGAHYDGLGTDARGTVYPGADDNATGVAVLLELAGLMSRRELEPRVGLVLAAFGAEEKDLQGSRAYVAAPSVPLQRLALMINVDMAGRKPRGYPVIGYQAFGREGGRNVSRIREAGVRAKVNPVAMQLGDRSDSASFAPHVPALFLCTAVHADYHQPTDTPDRVDYEQTARMLRLVVELVQGLECDSDRPR